jgi:hypothetical protein
VVEEEEGEGQATGTAVVRGRQCQQQQSLSWLQQQCQRLPLAPPPNINTDTNSHHCLILKASTLRCVATAKPPGRITRQRLVGSTSTSRASPFWRSWWGKRALSSVCWKAGHSARVFPHALAPHTALCKLKVVVEEVEVGGGRRGREVRRPAAAE